MSKGTNTIWKEFSYFELSKQDLLGILAEDLVAIVNDYIYPKDKQLSVWDRIYYEAVRILEFYVIHRTTFLALREAIMVDKQLETQWLKIHESLFKRVESDIKGSMKRGYYWTIAIICKRLLGNVKRGSGIQKTRKHFIGDKYNYYALNRNLAHSWKDIRSGS